MKGLLLLAALLPAAAFAASPEVWHPRQIEGVPYVSEMPSGGTVRTRSTSIPDGPGFQTWGEDLTVGDWPPGQGWSDMIRLSYMVGQSHVSLESSRKTWGKPTIAKKAGKRTIEVGYNDVVLDGVPLVEVHYIIELGPKKFVELLLQCRKDSFKQYAPYYVRMRDSLAAAN